MSGYHLDIKLKDRILKDFTIENVFKTDVESQLCIKMGESYGVSEIERIHNILLLLNSIFH